MKYLLILFIILCSFSICSAEDIHRTEFYFENDTLRTAYAFSKLEQASLSIYNYTTSELKTYLNNYCVSESINDKYLVCYAYTDTLHENYLINYSRVYYYDKYHKYKIYKHSFQLPSVLLGYIEGWILANKPEWIF